ncbi:MAG TPA: hypothetical protein VFQ80_19750, partial [Thermomicrobiales bacterium]|nr:hypothetical protein [Thermomicrobiales bacterium]
MPQAPHPAFERRDYELEITDNLQDLLAVLPPHLVEALAAVEPQLDPGALVEIVLDLGRRP